MRKEYVDKIKIINNAIFDFNKFLDPKFSIESFDLAKIKDNDYFTTLNDTTWEELRLPNGPAKGVYFMMGYDPNEPTNIGVYIGKANIGDSTIGKRLYAHLSKHKNSGNYTMPDLFGVTFNFEYIFSIDLDEYGRFKLASSFEEFLIENSKDKIHLLNGTGNY